MDFHFNAAITALNMAKLDAKDILEPDSRGRFSIGAIAKGKSYRVQGK